MTDKQGSMKIIKGNLLDAAVSGDISIIMHGCNCFHGLFSGIAGQISLRFPEVTGVDNQTLYGDTGKLATYSYASVTYELVEEPKVAGESWKDYPPLRLASPLDNPFVCLNLYTQYNTGNDFIASLFPPAIAHVNAAFAGHTIGIPLIACGIAGGDWEYVMGVLLTDGPDINWEVYVL